MALGLIVISMHEQDGFHYHFTSNDAIQADIAEGKFLEYAEVHGNIYGTSLVAIQSLIDQGKVCVLDIDVQGARAVRALGIKALFVFITPPTLDDLRSRLISRGTETEEQVDQRVAAALQEVERYERR